MPQATNVCAYDDFLFTVFVNAPCSLQIEPGWDPPTVAAGQQAKIVVPFIYQGGLGGSLATGFNGYVYARNDSLPNGDARTAGTPSSPAPGTDTAIPVGEFLPDTGPAAFEPDLSAFAEAFKKTGAQPVDGFFTGIPIQNAAQGADQNTITGSYWRGSCKVGPFPAASGKSGTDATVVHNETTIFTGRIELTQ